MSLSSEKLQESMMAVDGTAGEGAEPQLASMLVKGAAIYAIANFGTRALNFLLLPLYTRFLTPADYGIITMAEIAATVLFTVATMGLDPALRRDYFLHPEGSSAQRDTVATLLRFGLLTLAVWCAAFLLLGDWSQSGVEKLLSVAFWPYIAIAIITAGLTQISQYA